MCGVIRGFIERSEETNESEEERRRKREGKRDAVRRGAIHNKILGQVKRRRGSPSIHLPPPIVIPSSPPRGRRATQL